VCHFRDDSCYKTFADVCHFRDDSCYKTFAANDRYPRTCTAPEALYTLLHHLLKPQDCTPAQTLRTQQIAPFRVPTGSSMPCKRHLRAATHCRCRFRPAGYRPKHTHDCVAPHQIHVQDHIKQQNPYPHKPATITAQAMGGSTPLPGLPGGLTPPPPTITRCSQTQPLSLLLLQASLHPYAHPSQLITSSTTATLDT
jgi:hypothetical protein